MVRLMDEDSKQSKPESFADMIERKAIEVNAEARRKLVAEQPCQECAKKDAEIAELKEERK